MSTVPSDHLVIARVVWGAEQKERIRYGPSPSPCRGQVDDVSDDVDLDLLSPGTNISRSNNSRHADLYPARGRSGGPSQAGILFSIIWNLPPTTKQIWNPIQNRLFSHKTCYFLWMAIYHGYHIGNAHWKHMKGFKNRGLCTKYRADKTLEHILVKCWAPGQSKVWNLVSEFWKGKVGQVEKLSFTEILGVGLHSVKNAKGKILPEQTRLCRILIVEGAWLIWNLHTGSNDMNDNSKSD